MDAEGLTLVSQDDEPAEAPAPAPSAVGVIPLIPIEDAIHTYTSNCRRSYARNSGISVRSIGSTVSSLNGTVRSCGFGSLCNMLGRVLEAPPQLIIPRKQLRLRRTEVLGKGAYGLVVRGELYAGEGAALSETAATLQPSCNVSPSISPSTSESGMPSETVSTLEPSGEGDSERAPPALLHPMPPVRHTDPLAESVGSFASDAAWGSVSKATHSCTTLVDDNALFAKRAACTAESVKTGERHHAAPVPSISLPVVCESQISRSPSDSPRSVAVKLIDKARLSRRRQFVTSFQTELRLAGTLRHPSIIGVHGVVEVDAELLLVMDVAEGGSLKDYVRQQGLEEMSQMAPHLLADIVLGLEYLVSLGVAHRDLKPDNMLLTADHCARLADFGTACYLDDLEANRFGGTAAYMSPEVVETGRATATSDLWALGCVIFELFVGRPPFQGETSMLVMRKIKQYRSGTLEYPPYFPATARDLVERLIRREPDERLASTRTGGFPALKAHAFFTGVDWSGESAKPIPREVDYAGQIRDTLAEGERILRCAMIVKKSAGFLSTRRRRLLVLTDRPRLFYADPDTLDARKYIPITRDVYAEVESPTQFRVVTPKSVGGRTYIFRDLAERASLWGMRINDCVKQQRLTPGSDTSPVRLLRRLSNGNNYSVAGRGDGHGLPLAQAAPTAWGINRLFGTKAKSKEAK